MQKILNVLLILSLSANVLLVTLILIPKQAKNPTAVSNSESKSVKKYIYHKEDPRPTDLQTEPDNKYSFGALITKVIPDFNIPENLDVTVDSKALPLDTLQIKDSIADQNVLMKIDIPGSPMSNKLNESTIVAYSKKTVAEITSDEKIKAEKAKSSYDIQQINNNVTVLKRSNVSGPNGDSSIGLFSEIYLVDVASQNTGLQNSAKTFLIIPTHYLDQNTDILKKNIQKISIVDLPFIKQPID